MELPSSGFDHQWVGEPAGLLNMWRPAQGLPAGLMISPFAEEQGRCRRLQYDLSANMAAHGVNLVWLDLPGTGDSPLDETEITAAFWLACVRDALTFLAQSGHKLLWLGGLRLGAAVALHAARTMADVPQLIMLEPISGSYALRGVLRARLGQGEKGSDDLISQLKAGATVEAAGYPLNAATKSTLDHFTLDDSQTIEQRIIRSGIAEIPPWLQIEPTPAPALATDLVQQMAEGLRP